MRYLMLICLLMSLLGCGGDDDHDVDLDTISDELEAIQSDIEAIQDELAKSKTGQPESPVSPHPQPPVGTQPVNTTEPPIIVKDVDPPIPEQIPSTDGVVPSQLAFVFEDESEGIRTVYVMSNNGGHRRQLIDNGLEETPAWSWNREWIAYVNKERGGSNVDLCLVSSDGARDIRLARDTSIETPSWSPDGRKIAYAEDWDIYVMNANGTHPVNLTRNASQNVQPDWSPDGRRIVFSSGIDGGGRYNLFIINVDGTNWQRLTSMPSDEMYPDWSPDGHAIAFQGFQDGDFNIFVVGPSGRGLKQLTVGSHPSWSPDSQKIAYEFGNWQNRNIDIYTMNADGTDQRNITNSPQIETQPAWH